MKHNQNVRGRIPYTLILFFFFEILLKRTGLSINTSVYGLFFILIMMYYIFGIFSLKERYSFKEFLISSILNGIMFFVLLIFHKKSVIVIDYIVYTLGQNFCRYIFSRIYKRNVRVITLGKNQELIKAIVNNIDYSYLGFLDNSDENSLGKVGKLPKIIEEYQVEKVIYLKEEEELYLDEIYKLKLSGIRVMDSEEFLQNIEGKINIEKISKKWFLETNGFDVLSSTMDKRMKRAMDIFLSLIVLGVGLPFMAITYILVKMDNPRNFFSNPAFFYQNRIGLGGRVFKIVKFRSMKIHDPNTHSKYASEKDERITKIGKFIRKTRLDELPQIINVLNGDMSFVGPRPEWDILGREYEEKINMYRLRYAVKPGLTGWAQVMYPYGANLEDAKKKLEYDIYYIKNQNIALDIIILFKTIRVVLFGKGV